ncbi:hypothetical protein ACWNXI_02570 [Caldibacillus thermoamylovorans]
MKSKIRKVTFSAIVTSLLATSVLPVAHPVYAQKNENDENVTVIYGEEEEDVKALEVVFADENLMERTLQSAQNVGLEPKIKVQVASTAAVKAAIKGLLKNKSKVFALVENIGGKSARTALEKRWDKYVAPTLNNLLKYDYLVWKNIED